jgi:intracellular septation protein
MKFLFDLIPVILFFTVFKWGEGHQDAAHSLVQRYMGELISGGTVQAPQSPILLATIVLCLATLAQIGYLLVRGKKVDGLLWASALIMAIFGGLTIYFHDEDFIKWKPTILYWFFAASLLVGQLVFKKNLIRKAMEAQIKLPVEIWAKLNLVWTAFFVFLGFLNLFVAFVVFKADTGAWVSFKLFGITAIFFVFIIGQTMFLSKYMLEEDA